VIGSFRRAFTVGEPTALARRVLEFGMENAFFRSVWDETYIAETFTDNETLIRHVPDVGVLRFEFTDLIPSGQNDYLVRILYPSDEATRAALPRLEELGTQQLFDPETQEA
jgi:hypothetical protein